MIELYSSEEEGEGEGSIKAEDLIWDGKVQNHKAHKDGSRHTCIMEPSHVSSTDQDNKHSNSCDGQSTEDLLKEQQDLRMECMWVNQAIASRMQYLTFKKQLPREEKV